MGGMTERKYTPGETGTPERFLIAPGMPITAELDRQVRIGRFNSRSAAAKYFLFAAMQAEGLLKEAS